MKTYGKHEIFVLIEKLPNIKATPTEILKLRLRQREFFSIKTQNFDDIIMVLIDTMTYSTSNVHITFFYLNMD